MSRAIQPLLRTSRVLFQTQILRFEPETLTLIPISSSVSPQPRSATPSQIRSYVSDMRKSAFQGNMLRLLRNEIQYELERSSFPQPPAELNGFKVDQRPGQQWIRLEKQFGDNEEIKVEVTMFDGSIPVNKSGEKNSELLEEVQLHTTMIVSILKEESNKVLEFICSAWSNSLDIKKVYLRERTKMPRQPYTGPPFREFDDELQDSLYEFLEERGIDDSLCGLLHSYMSYKDKAEYIRWLQSIKSVIAEGAEA